jgi:hypothetical protein
LIIYVFLKRCDCTMTFRMRAGGASVPVEPWWNKEVGYCNYNKLAYTHTHTHIKGLQAGWSDVSVKNDFFSSFAMRKLWELAVWRS